MNPVIEEIYRTQRVVDGLGRSFNPFPTSIGYRQGVMLYDLVTETNAEETLEVGMAYGLATLFICQAHRDRGHGRHRAVDPYQEGRFKNIGLLNLQRAGLEPHLEFYSQPSFRVLPRLIERGDRLDFTFIDGMHLFDYVLVDLFYTDLMLKPGGHIMLDDIWLPSVRKALVFFLRNRRYRSVPRFVPRASRGIATIEPLPQPGKAKRTKPLRRRARRMLSLFLRNPLDFGMVTTFIRFALAGGLGWWVIQKRSDDERPWYAYRSF